jgi:hypothetical protein
LRPGGLFIQWLQAYEVDSLTVHTVVATARSAFNHVEVWQTLSVDLQLVCSTEPIKYSAAQLRERIASDVAQTALTRAWKMNDLEGFLGHFVANSQWADGVSQIPFLAQNTDDRTVLEYSFAKTVGSTTSFSVERLRKELHAAGQHRPLLVDDTIDWNLVEIRRQEFNLLFSGQLSLGLLPQSQDQALIEALGKFRLNEFAAAIDLWPAEHREPSDHIQRLAFARCYAELGRPECLELLGPAEEAHPIDAAALKAIYYWRAKNTAEAAKWIERSFTLLEESPWVISLISDPIFEICMEVAKADPTAAQRFYDQLSRPLASRRFHYLRLLTRVLVAQHLGSEQVAEALVPLEPDVIWSAEVLEPRAKAYTELNHPLAPRAQRELQWFQKHQTSDETSKTQPQTN